MCFLSLFIIWSDDNFALTEVDKDIQAIFQFDIQSQFWLVVPSRASLEILIWILYSFAPTYFRRFPQAVGRITLNDRS